MYSIIAIVCWFIVFTIGIKVDAQSLDDSLLSSVLFVLSATSTNIGILAVLASLIGNGGKPVDALCRGFTIYAMMASGVVVLFTESFTNPSVEQYGKIATSVSLVCLIVAYKPELFDGLLDRVAGLFRGTGKPSPEPPETTPGDRL